MACPRTYHNLTVLPDGNVLSMGGTRQLDGIRRHDRRAGGRDLGPDDRDLDDDGAEANGRGYHSTALLLPDGRVLVGRRRPAGRRSVPNQTQRGDLLAAVPVQGRRGRRSPSAPRASSTAASFTVGDAGRGPHREGRADPTGRSPTRSTRTSATSR